jgi:hypothetical protein
MKKRRSATYVEPTTLGDLRQILTDHENFPDSTRVWIRHNAVEGQPAWSSIEVSHAAEGAK